MQLSCSNLPRIGDTLPDEALPSHGKDSVHGEGEPGFLLIAKPLSHFSGFAAIASLRLTPRLTWRKPNRQTYSWPAAT